MAISALVQFGVYLLQTRISTFEKMVIHCFFQGLTWQQSICHKPCHNILELPTTGPFACCILCGPNLNKLKYVVSRFEEIKTIVK